MSHGPHVSTSHDKLVTQGERKNKKLEKQRLKLVYRDDPSLWEEWRENEYFWNKISITREKSASGIRIPDSGPRGKHHKDDDKKIGPVCGVLIRKYKCRASNCTEYPFARVCVDTHEQTLRNSVCRERIYNAELGTKIPEIIHSFLFHTNLCILNPEFLSFAPNNRVFLIIVIKYPIIIQNTKYFLY